MDYVYLLPNHIWKTFQNFLFASSISKRNISMCSKWEVYILRIASCFYGDLNTFLIDGNEKKLQQRDSCLRKIFLKFTHNMTSQCLRKIIRFKEHKGTLHISNIRFLRSILFTKKILNSTWICWTSLSGKLKKQSS